MRLIRFRIRTLAVTIAIVACALAAFEARRRVKARAERERVLMSLAERYKALALDHTIQAFKHTMSAMVESSRASSKAFDRDLDRLVRESQQGTVQYAILTRDLPEQPDPNDARETAAIQARIAQYKKRAEFHEQMEAKYEAAAQDPSRPVPADLPAPPVPGETTPPSTDQDSQLDPAQ